MQLFHISVKKMFKAGTVVFFSDDHGHITGQTGVIWKDCDATMNEESCNGYYSVVIDNQNVYPHQNNTKFWIPRYEYAGILSPGVMTARNMGLKIGFTCGAMDLLHAGHAMMLAEAKSQCDYLVVGVQSDPSIDRKEKNTPVMSYEERLIMAISNKSIDCVVPYTTEDELLFILKTLVPDVRIVGADHKGKLFTGHNMDIPIYFNTRNHNWSTSNLRERVANANKEEK